MAIGENLKEWDGRPVVDYDLKTGITDPVGTAYRVRELTYPSSVSFTELLAGLLKDPRASELQSLVIGIWQEWVGSQNNAEMLQALVASAGRLPALKSLFIGDITYEECEISWLRMSDFSPIFGAFPGLTALGIRGGNGLTLGIPRHSNLRELVLQAGGLPGSILHELVNGDLPALEHLELWLGTGEYGWSGTIADVGLLLQHQGWPNLRYLGLRNSEIADEIAATLRNAPLLEQLTTLDLSLGTLSNAGGEALLLNPGLSRLKKLDVSENFLSEAMVQKLSQLGPEIAAGEQRELEEYDDEIYRYVAHGE